MTRTDKPFVAGAAVLDSYGNAGTVVRQNWSEKHGWRVHYYVPSIPVTYRAPAADLRACPYCAADETCALHQS